MKWGFVLVTLYMGPLGLLLYVMADKEPKPGTHEAFVAPLWKQSVGSTIHCCAGYATGIIVAAAITAPLGLPMWLDYLALRTRLCWGSELLGYAKLPNNQFVNF